MLDHLGLRHRAGVDDDGVVSGPQRRHRSRGVQVVAALDVGQHCLVIVGQPGRLVLVVAAARTLLTRGFANEVLGWIGAGPVRHWCEHVLTGRLRGGRVVEQA